MKTMMLLALVLLGTLLARETQAFYNPSTGRWLTRDPIWEEGFKSATRTRAPLKQEDENNRYAFIRNDGLNQSDMLGLYGWINYPHIKMKRCGTAVSRAIDPEDDPSWWQIIHETISGFLYPHEFVILADGTRLTHGGSADGENHRTAKKSPIYIDQCKSCDEFSKCMKQNWPEDSKYTWYSHNCGYAVGTTVSRCGGSLFVPWISP